MIRVSRRIKFPTGIRLQVAAGQGWKCAACSQLLPPSFHLDHIVALKNNGSNHKRNLQALCPNCHATKTYVDNHPQIAAEFNGHDKKHRDSRLQCAIQ
jgi:5-methylcytosine-specific restriction endonuclease McrA